MTEAKETVGELKGCPFCGGKAKVHLSGMTGNCVAIRCSDCGSSSPRTGNWSKAMFVNAWNVRAEKAAVMPGDVAQQDPILLEVLNFIELCRSLKITTGGGQIVDRAIEREELLTRADALYKKLDAVMPRVCHLCEKGFPVNALGFHYGTQKHGMIQTTPCAAYIAEHSPQSAITEGSGLTAASSGAVAGEPQAESSTIAPANHTKENHARKALDAFNALYRDEDTYFQSAHHLFARFCNEHRETIRAALSASGVSE